MNEGSLKKKSSGLGCISFLRFFCHTSCGLGFRVLGLYKAPFEKAVTLSTGLFSRIFVDIVGRMKRRAPKLHHTFGNPKMRITKHLPPKMNPHTPQITRIFPNRFPNRFIPVDSGRRANEVCALKSLGFWVLTPASTATIPLT